MDYSKLKQLISEASKTPIKQAVKRQINESVVINEAIRSKDFSKSAQLIKKYLQNKLGKTYFYPTPEVFKSASRKGVGIKFFLKGDKAIRLNWAGNNVGNSNSLVSMDYWDGSKSPQPYPSNHIQFDELQSLVKILPFIVDFVNGKIDDTGSGIFVNESIQEHVLSEDFNSIYLTEANYSSGDLQKTVSNMLGALSQGISISDQNKAGGVKKYGPRWNKAVEFVKQNYGNLFTKDGLKHVILPSDVKKIDAAKVLASISGGADAVAFTVSTGSQETVDVAGADEEAIERMSYEEQLDSVKSAVKLLLAGATQAIILSGPGGTGKTQTVEDTLAAMGKTDGNGYTKISGSISPAGLYRVLFENKNSMLFSDDCDDLFKDQEGRNLLKAACDTKKIRKISWMKAGGKYVAPEDYDPENDNGDLPRSFEFSGKLIAISNLALDKLDPDGAFRTRAYVLNIDPTNEELYEFMTKIAGKIVLDVVGYELSLADRLKCVDILKSRKLGNKLTSIRSLVRAVNTMAGILSQGGTEDEYTKFIKRYA